MEAVILESALQRMNNSIRSIFIISKHAPTQGACFLLLLLTLLSVTSARAQLHPYLQHERTLESLGGAKLDGYVDSVVAHADPLEARFVQALLLSRKSNFAAANVALAELDTLLEPGPAQHIVAFWRGQALGYIGKTGQSFVQYKRLLDALPNAQDSSIMIRGHLGVGNIFSDQGRQGEAIASYGKVQRYFTQHPDPFMVSWAESAISNALADMEQFAPADSLSDLVLARLEQTPFVRRLSKQLASALFLAQAQDNAEKASRHNTRMLQLESVLQDSLLIYSRQFKSDYYLLQDSISRHPELFAFLDKWDAYARKNDYVERLVVNQSVRAYAEFQAGDSLRAFRNYFNVAKLAHENEINRIALDHIRYALWFADQTSVPHDEYKAAVDLNTLLQSQNREESEFLASAMYNQLQETVTAERTTLETRNQLAIQKANQRTTILIGVAALLLALLAYRHQRTRRKTAQLELAQQEQEAQQEVQSLLERHRYENLVAQIQGEESERDRLAKEIHDGVGGVLAGIALKMESEHGSSPGMSELTKALRQTHDDLRNISHNLALPALEDNSLVELSKEMLAGLRSMHGYEIGFTVFPDSPMRLDPQLEVQLYRVLQELTNNIVKHAEASQVEVSFTLHPDELNLIVADNGKGFDPAAVKNGLGQRTVRERVAPFGGTVRVESAPGNGTTATVVIPDPKRREA